jgi:hypothetical protein
LLQGEEVRDSEMNLIRRIFWLLFFILLLQPPVLFSAEIYRWTDEKGTIHITDDPSNIPEANSKQGEKIQIPEEKRKDVHEPLNPDDRSDRVKKYLEEMDKKIEAKKKIETRISQLEAESRSIEERLKWIEEYEQEDFQYYQPFRDQRTGKWVNVASPYYDEKRRLTYRMESIKEELKSLQEELSKINRSL